MVNAAIDFNEQARTMAKEIGNERAERRLPSKMSPLQRQATKLDP